MKCLECGKDMIVVKIVKKGYKSVQTYECPNCKRIRYIIKK